MAVYPHREWLSRKRGRAILAHAPRSPKIVSQALAFVFATLTTAFPDLRITLQIILAEDVRVGARWFVEATHKGRFGEIPPTGKHVRLTGTAIVQIRNGQIVEEHANSDALGLLRQLEVGPVLLKIPPLVF